MKKFKLVLWIIILAFLGLFLYQNKDFFMSKHILSLKIPFFQQYYFPEAPNAVLFLAFLLFGLLIAYFFSLLERFKANKTIKNLSATVDSNLEMISSLKSELSTATAAGSTNSIKPDENKEGIEQKV